MSGESLNEFAKSAALVKEQSALIVVTLRSLGKF